MKNIIAYLVLFLLITHSAIALSFRQNASLLEHMTEVNKEWMAFSSTDLLKTFCFQSDEERIQMHLFLVINYLENNYSSEFSEFQLEKRNESLDKLRAYALDTNFPKNSDYNIRIPYFIDHENTACAVGQMLRNSGNEEICQWIKKEMNNAYIAEIPTGALDIWAKEYGFTREELAWIQPGYPPSLSGWSSMQNGVNGTAKVLIEYNEQLIIAGDFSDASGLSVNNVVAWNGMEYSALGDGVNGHVNCAIIYQGKLTLGGAFNGGFADVAIWDGSTWEYQTAFASKYGETTTFGIYLDKLYAGGSMQGFAGQDFVLMIWENPNWSFVAEFEGGSINSIVQLGDEMIVGGNFFSIFENGINTEASNIAKFNNQGSWEEFNGGLDGFVNDIKVVGNEVLVAGSIVENIVIKYGLVQSNFGAWDTLIGENSFYANNIGSGPFGYFNKVFIQEGDTLLIGSYSCAFGMENGTNLSELKTVNDWGAGDPYFVAEDEVFDLIYFQDKLIIAGAFTSLTGVEFSRVAQFEAPNSISEISNIEYHVYPNPAIDRVTLEFLSIKTGEIKSVVLYDIMGKIASSEFQFSENKLEIDLSALSDGAYVLNVVSNKGEISAKIIISK